MCHFKNRFCNIMKMRKTIILIIFLIDYIHGEDILLVETKQGLVRGIHADDGDNRMFLGIPYAQVNLTNPFGESLPTSNFTDIFEANDGTNVCPQIENFNGTLRGSLHCLRVNIYVPNNASTSNKVPVIVWIHGGGANVLPTGELLFRPTYLIQRDVIVITVNYRAGVYGFMCLDTPEVPGNQAHKDQYKALQWIKTNIAAFGGDENRITMMGESGGSKSVDYHLLSKRDKIFHQAILMSGTALCPSELVKSDTSAPSTLARHLGFETEDMLAALDFLATVDPRSVVVASRDSGSYFRACVEKEFDNVEPFVSENPEYVIPTIRDMPILAGFTSQEQLLVFINRPPEFFTDLQALIFNPGFEFEDVEDNVVRRFYLGDEEFNINKKWKLMDFASDYKFNHPIQRILSRYLEHGGNNIYQYMFSYNGGMNFEKRRANVTEGGAAHADQLGYLFNLIEEDITPSADDQLMIDRLTTLWANFAKYGNPTPETSDLLPVKWEPITKDVIKYLDIDSELTLKSRPYHDRLAFWDLFHIMYPEKFIYN